MNLHLRDYQLEVFNSKSQINILRWGRQTGKDVLIDAMIDKETDFVIMPQSMAAEHAEKWEGQSVFQDGLVNKGLMHYIKKRQVKGHRTKQIFLNECASFDVELLQLMKLLLTEWPKVQLYLISTPRGGWKLFERGMAGLEFDMMCANLEMHKVHDWFYSNVSTRRVDQEPPVNYKHLDSNIYNQEIEAGWWDI